MSEALKIDPSFIRDITKVSTEDVFEDDNSTYDNVEHPPKERGECYKAIQILKTYTKDWDGNDSLPPHPKALETAETFIQSLPWQREFPIAIYPCSDQSLVLEWKDNEENGKLVLTIDPHHIGAVSLDKNDAITDRGDFTLFTGDVISSELQDIVPRTV